MAIILDKKLQEKLDMVSRREWWPVSALAETLGKPKMFIYRKIDSGQFDVLSDGGFTKILSASVVKYFEEER